MTPTVEDFGERVAICVEAGVPLERARRIAAVQVLGATVTPAGGADGRGHGDDGRMPHEGAGGRR